MLDVILDHLNKFIRVLSVPLAISVMIAILYLLAAPPRDLNDDQGKR